jgi:hypothetical protein
MNLKNAPSRLRSQSRPEASGVNCPFRRLAYPRRGEATNRVLLGRPGIESGCQG